MWCRGTSHFPVIITGNSNIHVRSSRNNFKYGKIGDNSFFQMHQVNHSVSNMFNPLIVTDKYSHQLLLMEFLLLASILVLISTYFSKSNSTQRIAISAVNCS